MGQEWYYRDSKISGLELMITDKVVNLLRLREKGMEN